MRTTRSARWTAVTASAALAALLPPSPAQAQAPRPRAAEPLPAVTAAAETATLYDDEAGGNANADDPAIWRNEKDPELSLVVATAKEGGLRVYGLDARLKQSVPAPGPPREGDAPGRFNNVDLVRGLRLPSGPADVAVTTDRGGDRLRTYRIDPSRPGGPLVDVTDPDAAPVFSAGQDEINAQHTAYGLATWQDRATGRAYALVSRRNETRIALLELLPTTRGTVTYRKVRTLDLPAAFTLPNGTRWSPCAEPGELPQVEGMVVDPASGVLYAGQEDVGIWRLRADLRGGAPVLVDKVKEYGVPGTYDDTTEECVAGSDPGYGGKHLAADVEGLTLLQGGKDGKSEKGGKDRKGRKSAGRLLASSQGDNTFAVYDREFDGARDDNDYEGGFRIKASSGATGPDGVEECDGAAVLDEPLGRRFPRGLLVVQDGHDTPAGQGGDGAEREATGFKFVDLGRLKDASDAL
ncbi:phytase [Streptomyces sp. NPDC021093]|uniref:phytase n=1 Tax=Streptomyces sp. NPDC021093 TaxID=3365112 RepID=UPI0037A4D58A